MINNKSFIGDCQIQKSYFDNWGSSLPLIFNSLALWPYLSINTSAYC